MWHHAAGTPDDARCGAQWRRDTCRISQADTAALLGINRSTVARYEAGRWPVPPWYGWALLGARRAIKSQILKRKRRDRYNAKRNATRRRVQRIRRTHRNVQRLNNVRLDVLAKIVDRGLENGIDPDTWAAVLEVSDEIHGLEQSLPRRVRG